MKANAQLVKTRTLRLHLERSLREAGTAMALRDQELGKRIQATRIKKGWKQKELAVAVSVEPQTVSRWERARSTPDIEMLRKVAEHLNQPLSYYTAHLDVVPDLPANGLDDRLAALEGAVGRLAVQLADASTAIETSLGNIETRLEAIEDRLPALPEAKPEQDPQTSSGG